MRPARAAYQALRQQLAASGLTAANEANVLFACAAGRTYNTVPDAELTDEQAAALDALLARRLGGEPLQYIAGSWPFLDFELAVGPGVLIPRPETEQVALKAIDLLKDMAHPSVLDLCSGSGCIAIAVARARPDAAVAAVELEPAAFRYLTRNTAALAPEIAAVEADVRAYCAACAPASLDLITANPPYVTPDEYRENEAELRFEPKSAFLGGADGLDFYRAIIRDYAFALKKDGLLLFETGFNQTEMVAELFAESGYRDVRTVTDDFGLPRMVFAQK